MEKRNYSRCEICGRTTDITNHPFKGYCKSCGEEKDRRYAKSIGISYEELQESYKNK